MLESATTGAESSRAMFWNRKRAATDAPSAWDGVQTSILDLRATPLPSLDDALETLAALLRTLGRYGLGRTEVERAALEQEYEGWATHVLVAAPPPGSGVVASFERSATRDWNGLRRFLIEHRRQEQQEVTASLDDLREVIWASVETLKTALALEQEADDRVIGRLDQLRHVVEGGSTEEIKREVLSSVGALSELVEERKQRQQMQVRQLGARISTLGHELQEARRESSIDPLTGLFNRRALDDHLANVVSLRGLFGQPAVLFMIDVDHFKRINDEYGHPTGDRVLQALADCLTRSFLRKADFVARYGGEEFAVILPDTGVCDGAALAERLLRAVRGLRISTGEHALQLTVSLGLAELAPNDTPATWLERADRALYQAKQAGRDQVAIG